MIKLSSNTIWPSAVSKETTQKALHTCENILFIFIKHEDDRMEALMGELEENTSFTKQH